MSEPFFHLSNRVEPTGVPLTRRDSFWREAFAVRGSVTLRVSRDVLLFTLLATAIYALDRAIHPDLGIEVAPYEVAGAALGLLLVLRTNAGYERWWEGRKLWGGIVNDCRTLVTNAIANGPDDPAWRRRIVTWTCAFPHAVRQSLRHERDPVDFERLLGAEEAGRVIAARHMPTVVAGQIALLLREASTKPATTTPLILAAEMARSRLIDHLGGCERIQRSPLPRVYGINIRRFIFLFLATLPFAFLSRIGWLTPPAELLVAYPILSIDQIGVDLQNPFTKSGLGHLPLDDYTAMIEADLMAILGDDRAGQQ